MNNYADTDVRGFSDDEVIELERQADAISADIYYETERNYGLEVEIEDEHTYLVRIVDYNVREMGISPSWTYPDLDTAERELKIIVGYPA